MRLLKSSCHSNRFDMDHLGTRDFLVSAIDCRHGRDKLACRFADTIQTQALSNLNCCPLLKQGLQLTWCSDT